MLSICIEKLKFKYFELKMLSELKKQAIFGLFIEKFTKSHTNLFLLFFHKNKNILNQSFIYLFN